MAEVYVLVGGPCTGKTSVINELKEHGYKIIEEAARALSEKRCGMSKADFQNAIFEYQKKGYEDAKDKEGIVFSDRGLGDTIAYYLFHGIKVPKEVLNYFKGIRYKGVFVLEPVPGYERDSFRTEGEIEQRRIHELIVRAYKEAGYDIVKVPLMSVEERVKFLVKNIRG